MFGGVRARVVVSLVVYVVYGWVCSGVGVVCLLLCGVCGGVPGHVVVVPMVVRVVRGGVRDPVGVVCVMMCLVRIDNYLVIFISAVVPLLHLFS